MSQKVRIPSWDEIFMKHCYIIASRSKDISTQIGSVIVRDKVIISEGYNDFPRGVNDYAEGRRERPLKLLYTGHSEANSINNCARHGTSCLGATLYTFGYPCAGCMIDIINGGIKEIVIHKQWMERAESFYKDRWNESQEASEAMLNEAGIKLRYFDGDVGLGALLSGEYLIF